MSDIIINPPPIDPLADFKLLAKVDDLITALQTTKQIRQDLYNNQIDAMIRAGSAKVLAFDPNPQSIIHLWPTFEMEKIEAIKEELSVTYMAFALSQTTAYNYHSKMQCTFANVQQYFVRYNTMINSALMCVYFNYDILSLNPNFDKDILLGGLVDKIGNEAFITNVFNIEANGGTTSKEPICNLLRYIQWMDTENKYFDKVYAIWSKHPMFNHVGDWQTYTFFSSFEAYIGQGTTFYNNYINLMNTLINETTSTEDSQLVGDDIAGHTVYHYEVTTTTYYGQRIYDWIEDPNGPDKFNLAVNKMTRNIIFGGIPTTTKTTIKHR